MEGFGGTAGSLIALVPVRLIALGPDPYSARGEISRISFLILSSLALRGGVSIEEKPCESTLL